ncbi:MAG: PH domain-containing protein [Acidobacteriota bacterium]|nr:PH domain-containing protein [Acidobacteriota bacterium]
MDHTEDQAIFAVSRPHPNLRISYLLRSLFWGPLFPFAFFIYLRRYATLTYRFDQHGITVSWGHWSKREISVLYERIQDINLRIGVIERHIGLARLEIQTASGDAGAEITVEGFQEYQAIQRFLQRRTRREPNVQKAETGVGEQEALADILTQVTHELRGLREDLNRKRDEEPTATPQESGGAS